MVVTVIGSSAIEVSDSLQEEDDFGISACNSNEEAIEADRSTLIPGISDDGTLYPIEKLRAHQLGTHHLAISIFLFSDNQILLQRRARDKYHSGGLWTNACCSHPHWGETANQCANRRLVEELGVSCKLEPHAIVEYKADVGQGLIEHERVQIFSAEVDKDNFPISPNPLEVCDTIWLPCSDLKAIIADEPERFTRWFRIYINRWDELGLDYSLAAERGQFLT